eukprot:10817418-Alexandrium_andersonii.AAC.1
MLTVLAPRLVRSSSRAAQKTRYASAAQGGTPQPAGKRKSAARLELQVANVGYSGHATVCDPPQAPH